MKQEPLNENNSTEFDSLLAESINNNKLKEGTIIKGKIAEFEEDSIFVDIGDIVEGIIAKNLTYNELMKLDRFEGENYFRQFIKIKSSKNIEDAQVYLPKANLISSEPWDYDDWYQNDMKKFFENEFDLNGVK